MEVVAVEEREIEGGGSWREQVAGRAPPLRSPMTADHGGSVAYGGRSRGGALTGGRRPTGVGVAQQQMGLLYGFLKKKEKEKGDGSRCTWDHGIASLLLGVSLVF